MASQLRLGDFGPDIVCHDGRSGRLRGVRLRWPRAASALFALICILVTSFVAGMDPGIAGAHTAVRAEVPGPLTSVVPADAASGIVADGLPSVSIAVSANATQDEPVTITVSGEAEASRKLFVYVSAAGVCAGEPASNAGGEWLSGGGGDALPEGSFEMTYEYIPESVGSYIVCAYVDETEVAAPDVSAEESFDASRPAGSASIQVSPSPTRDKPVTITVSGETEVARKLFVYIDDAGHGCEPDPGAESGGEWLSTAGGEALAAGVFKIAYKYTPAAVGIFTVCAYVDESESAVPDAAAEESFEATDWVSVQVSANPIRGEPATLVISGESRAGRRLFVYISSAGNGCEALPEAEREAGREELSREHGEALAAGSFKVTYRYTPEFIGTYTLCAFVDESEAAIPAASATASFTSSPSLLEVEERAAKVKAEEELAKAAREAEVAAREAARAAQEAAAKAAREAAAVASQEAAARAVHEAAERAAAEAAAAAAQAARLKAARSKPVTRLTVSAVAHDGPSLAHPGYTSLVVTTSPFAFVTVRLTRNGHRTVRREWGEQASAVAAEVSWSCHHPGGTYLYTVTARTGVGRKLSKRGRFAPVSAARCHELEGQEANTGEHQRAQAKEREAREYDEELQRRERAEHEEREQQEATCRQEGGTPTIVVGSEGATWVCEAPDGGTLPRA
jgi:hypothetical protein